MGEVPNPSAIYELKVALKLFENPYYIEASECAMKEGTSTYVLQLYLFYDRKLKKTLNEDDDVNSSFWPRASF